jgi:transglutaminase-like putative cysteine protease
MKLFKKTVIFTITIFLVLPLSSVIGSKEISIINSSNGKGEEDAEIVLLRQENIIRLIANEYTDIFSVTYAFPPDYKYQIPLFLEVSNDTTAYIIHYQIENDKNEPNKLINFTIGPMEKKDEVYIHFFCWVLVNNYDYSDFPDYVKIPKLEELPNETIKWLSSTESVQVDNLFIKLKARQLRRFTEDNLIKLVRKTLRYTEWQRKLLFRLEYKIGILLNIWLPQDAVTTFFFGGDCPGKSHLGCAVLRANNIPTRIVQGIFTDRPKSWMEAHLQTEYYCPDWGWILTEMQFGISPLQPKERFIMRICYPEDENNTGPSFVCSTMKYLEQWIWIDSKNSDPNYKVSVFSSNNQAHNENEIKCNSDLADDVIILSKSVYYQYEFYLGMDLEGENLEHFQNANEYQRDAIREVSLSDNLEDYASLLENASEEYSKIIV